MRALVQRVSSASVAVGGEVVGAIGRGLCTFVGVTQADDAAVAERLARRVWGLRIFPDARGDANLSAEELGLKVLVVSQFTLYADTSRGRRPSFVRAAPAQQAERLVEAVTASLVELGARVATGRFGASMQVRLVNEGPFSLLVEV